MKTNKEMKEIIHALAKKYGKGFMMELTEFLHGDEERFDPEDDCGIRSCRNCGACPSYDDGIVESIPVKTLREETADEPTVYLWKVECYVCGETYEEEGIEAES